MKKFRDREVPGKASGNGAGNPGWRDGDMTTAHLFDRLSAELDRLGPGAAGRACLDRLARAGVDLAGVRTPLELALACRAPRGRWARANLAVLVRLVPGDDVATLVVLVALVPALVRAAQRLAGVGVDIDEAEGVVVTVALSALAELEPAADGDVASAVVARVWSRCRSQARREALLASRHRPLGAEADDPVDETATAAGGTLDAVLGQAVRRGVLGRHHAVLLIETRVLGRPLAEVAAARGTTPGALASLRGRAEDRLLAMVLAEEQREGSTR